MNLGQISGPGCYLIPELSTSPHPLAHPFSATPLPWGNQPPISPSPAVSTLGHALRLQSQGTCLVLALAKCSSTWAFGAPFCPCPREVLGSR